MNKPLYILACLVFLFFCLPTKAQSVSVYKIDALVKRIYNNSDTTYIVNFWATWCKPCVEELPEFEKLQQAYKGQPVKVILVSLDFVEELQKRVMPFLAKNNYSSEVILLDEVNGNEFINKINEQWSGAIPATLITSKNKYKQVFIEKKVTFSILENELKK